MYRSHVLVCGGTGCTSSGSERIISALEHEIQDNGLSEEVKVIKTGCFGLCALGPIMIVYPEGASLQHGQTRKTSPKSFPSICSKDGSLPAFCIRKPYRKTR